MTTAIRAKLIEQGHIKPAVRPIEVKACRTADFHTQQDVLREKTRKAVRILEQSLRRSA